MTCKRVTLCLLGLAMVWAGPLWAFDGQRAMELIEQQCAMGPRVPGTEAHAQGAAWIEEQLGQLGLIVQKQPFDAHLALSDQQVEAVNIFGLPSMDGPASPTLILSAHWDTRPWADHDPSGTNPPMLGANDGASGVAMALELARMLAKTPVRDHVVLMFWDAEDAGVAGDDKTWCLGARYAARHAPDWIGQVVLGINLDLVAGDPLRVQPEKYSLQACSPAVLELWRIGGLIQPEVFDMSVEHAFVDDHLPWIERGVPFIDFIGLPWEHWHTAKDDPAHCSAQSMEALGMVLLNYLHGGQWKTLPRARVLPVDGD